MTPKQHGLFPRKVVFGRSRSFLACLKAFPPYAIGGAAVARGEWAHGRCGCVDARQAGARHGRRQQSVDCLGHCARLPGARRRAGSDLPGRRSQEAGRAACRRAQRPCRRPLRRDRAGDPRCGLCRGRTDLGRPRFPRPRHRLLRQGSARRALRRHHRRQFLEDPSDLLLLLHGG
jgi:hypothetical protein